MNVKKYCVAAASFILGIQHAPAQGFTLSRDGAYGYEITDTQDTVDPATGLVATGGLLIVRYLGAVSGRHQWIGLDTSITYKLIECDEPCQFARIRVIGSDGLEVFSDHTFRILPATSVGRMVADLRAGALRPSTACPKRFLPSGKPVC